MERSRARCLGAGAVVCALGLASVSRAAAADASTTARLELAATQDSAGVVIYPARAPGAHPITVLLHGMCGAAARACRFFADEVTLNSNLICPRASARCAGGGASWPEQGVEAEVESAVTRAKAALGDAVDEAHGRTLIGYSLGAFRALRIAQGGTSPYPRVMLIGARVALDRAKLEQNGVQRLLLCAGAWDMMHDHMQRESARMHGAGLHARFLDLGPVGHALTASFVEYLPEALSWLSGG